MCCDTHAVSYLLISAAISGLIYRAMGETRLISRGASTNVPFHRLPYGLLPGSLRRATSCWLARSLATGACRTREVMLKVSLTSSFSDDAPRRRGENLAAKTGAHPPVSLPPIALRRPQIYVGAGERDYVPMEKRVPVEGDRETPSVVLHSG